MQTHEDPEGARERFKIVNRILGWGNPRVPIWFIGLEEAGEWGNPLTGELTSEDKETLEKFEKWGQVGWIPVEKDQTQEDVKEYKKEGKRFTSIYGIMSKLVLEIKEGKPIDWKLDDNKKRWKDYSKNLFVGTDQTVPDVCQANLYPLGKKGLDVWPCRYKKLFGFGPEKEDQRRFKDEVHKYRFPLIFQHWQAAKPVITVCFGKTKWNEFTDKENLFGKLLNEQNNGEQIDNCIFYHSAGIVLTPFFTPRRGCMKDERIRFLAERLRPLWNHRTSPHNQL